MIQQWQKDFKNKLKQAESLLMEAEEILKDNGVQTPVDQPNIESLDKIQIPTGYIRKASEFRIKYRLMQLIDDVNVRSNIAYALQASDLLNYFLNRFKITLSAESIFYKISTVHIFSIIEALLYGTVNKYHICCLNRDGSVCKHNNKCDLYIKKANNYTFNDLIKLLIEKNILNLTNDEQEGLCVLKDIRDRIHIWDTKNNELIDITFTRSHYNNAIRMLAHMRDCFNENFSKYEARLDFCDLKEK